MPTIEMNVAVIVLAAVVPALIAFLLQVARIRSLKSKILDQEFEMVKTHSQLLDLEKENTELRRELKNNSQAGVISMKEKGKVAAG